MEIMKTYGYLSLLAVFAVSTSCNKDGGSDAAPAPAAQKIIVEAAMNGGSFDEGDVLGVAFGEELPMLYTMAEDGSWAAEEGKDLFWPDSYEEPAVFTAYYPATAGVSYSSFILPSDQSSAEKIAAADYMKCTKELYETPEDETLYLDMKRRTARVIINVTGVGEELGAVTAAEVISQYSAISPIAEEGPVKAVKAYKLAENKFMALVIPGNGVSGEVFIRLTTDNGKYEVNNIRALSAGETYEYSVFVGNSSADLSDPVVSEWTEGTLDGITTWKRIVAVDRTDWAVTGKFDEREWDEPSNFRHIFDGDVSTYWASDWSGDGDAIDQPVILVIDTKSEQSFSRVGIMHRAADFVHDCRLEFYVSSDERTWWDFDHDAFWEGKTSGGVDRNSLDYSWRTDTNWDSQENWIQVGGEVTMRNLPNPEVEYIELDSSKSGRYFIIKCPEGGRGTRNMLEFAEIYLYQTITE